MGGIATCRKIETEAEVEAEEVEAAWKLTTSTSLVDLKVHWFKYQYAKTSLQEKVISDWAKKKPVFFSLFFLDLKKYYFTMDEEGISTLLRCHF